MVQPTGISLACLSCHDGASNMDAFSGVAGSTTMGATSTGNLGIDLTNDHPVGFAIVNGTDSAIKLLTNITVPLFGASTNMIECSSCHDVHNGTAFGNMLVMTNAGSALCLDCHIK
jgi:predicted CXXCH cytochrome family protein